MVTLDKSLLASIEYFDSSSDNELEEILNAPENGIEEFAHKEFIFYEDDIGEYLYIMLEGQAEVFVHSNTTFRDVSISAIRPGHHFGNRSATSEKEAKRSASVLATLDSKIFKIHKKYVLNAINNKDKPKIDLPPDEARDTVTSIPLFKGLNNDEIINFRDWAIIVEYKKNDFIYQQGMDADYLYVLLEGAIDILKKNGDENFIIEMSEKEGEYFGAMELLPDSTGKYSNYARASEDSHIIKISKSIFTALLERNKTLGDYLKKINKLKLLKKIGKSQAASLSDLDKLKTKL
jgi:CRP-like cAMP-binding protein